MFAPSPPFLRAFGAQKVGGARRPVGASCLVLVSLLCTLMVIGDSTTMAVRGKEDAPIDDDVFLFWLDVRTHRSL